MNGLFEGRYSCLFMVPTILSHQKEYTEIDRDREVWNRYGRIETGLWFTWPRSCINPLPTAVWIEGSSASWSLTNLAEMSSLFICSLPPCLDLELIFPIWSCRQASWSILVCSPWAYVCHYRSISSLLFINLKYCLSLPLTKGSGLGLSVSSLVGSGTLQRIPLFLCWWDVMSLFFLPSLLYYWCAFVVGLLVLALDGLIFSSYLYSRIFIYLSIFSCATW